MVDSVQNQINSLQGNIDQLETQLTSIKKAIPRIVDDVQRQAAIDVAAALNGQIAALSNLLANLQAGQPKLPPPSSDDTKEFELGASKVGVSPWLAPSAILAFISVMMYVLKQSALYAAVEGQNTSKGMQMQQTLGSQEADLQRHQGDLELTKSVVAASMDVAGGVVAAKGVINRGKAIKDGPQTAAGKAANQRVDDHADAQIATNATRRTQLNRQIAVTQSRINGPGPGYAGAKPAAPGVSPARKKELEAKNAARKEELKKLDEKDIEINNHRSNAKEENLRQELATQEQKSRAYDHWINAASKLSDGVMNQQIKYVDAEITMTRTGMDILKTFIGSATKGESEGREGAKAAADAMNQALSSRTATYYKTRA